MFLTQLLDQLARSGFVALDIAGCVTVEKAPCFEKHRIRIAPVGRAQKVADITELVFTSPPEHGQIAALC